MDRWKRPPQPIGVAEPPNGVLNSATPAAVSPFFTDSFGNQSPPKKGAGLMNIESSSLDGFEDEARGGGG